MDSTLPTPWLDDGDVNLDHGDCGETLPLLEAVDAVVNDPLYPDTRFSGIRR
jgi:hypothetical protein